MDPENVAMYVRRYEFVRDAALSVEASCDLLNEIADEITG